MKKTFAWLLSLVLALCACASADPVFDTSVDPADAEANAMFSDVWIGGSYSSEIWYEDGSFCCYVFLNVSEDEGIIWEYASCRYDAASNALVCSEGTKVHDVFDIERMELSTQEVGTSLSCVFTLTETGTLLWKADDAGESVELMRLDAAEAAGLLDETGLSGAMYEGSWASGRASLDVSAEDGAYRCRISWADSYAELTEWDYLCAYDDETGRLIGTGTKYTVVYGEDGEEVSRSALWEGGEVSFSLEGFTVITWEDRVEDAGKGMQFTPLDVWGDLDSFDPVWFFEGTWTCGEAQISVQPQDGLALCTVVLPGQDGGSVVWEYACAYDDETSALVNNGTGTKTVFAPNDPAGRTEASDRAASFWINDDLLLIWEDKNEGSGSSLAFEYLVPTAEAPTPEEFAEGFFRPVASIQPGTAGASLRQAAALSGACAFAVEYEMWNPDPEAVRGNMRDAWDGLTQEERDMFAENFPGLISLMERVSEDWEANRAIFEDAGSPDDMEAVLFDPLGLLAWESLVEITQSVTGADQSF